MRILIIEDEFKLAEALKRGLEQEKFAVDAVYSAEDGYGMIAANTYDTIILDRMLPGGIDGTQVLRLIRQKGNQTPVLFLTAKDNVDDRVEGLNAGADDYLIKPFAFEELVARVRALLRRPQKGSDTTLRYQDLSLDPIQFHVERAGTHINLTAKEFALLEYFMRNPNRVITKENIISHVWDYDADVLPNTVEVYVGYLRQKIDKPFNESLIHTRHGFGYVFGIKKKE